jgi:hypothetical protein
MEKINSFFFSIDTKSLYWGIYNDNDFGHTATVSTNLKQGSSTKKELELFYKISNQINIEDNDLLIKECVKNSKALVKITNFFYFHHILVNNIEISSAFDFGLFIKEEIDKSAFQCGRIKLHYPTTLKYSDYQCDVNNKEVIKCISSYIGDYAFIVRGFEVFYSSGTINFLVSVIGEKDIPYSKVFIDKKGVGNKFNKVFNEEADSYDFEIKAIKRYYKEEVNTQNYREILSEFESKACEIILDKLKCENAKFIIPILKEYPYSPVDIEYFINNVKNDIILKTTSTGIDYFFISKLEWKYLVDHKDTCKVVLLKKICSDNPEMKYFNFEDISNMEREISNMKIFN